MKENITQWWNRHGERVKEELKFIYIGGTTLCTIFCFVMCHELEKRGVLELKDWRK